MVKLFWKGHSVHIKQNVLCVPTNVRVQAQQTDDPTQKTKSPKWGKLICPGISLQLKPHISAFFLHIYSSAQTLSQIVPKWLTNEIQLAISDLLLGNTVYFVLLQMNTVNIHAMYCCIGRDVCLHFCASLSLCAPLDWGSTMVGISTKRPPAKRPSHFEWWPSDPFTLTVGYLGSRQELLDESMKSHCLQLTPTYPCQQYTPYRGHPSSPTSTPSCSLHKGSIP